MVQVGFREKSVPTLSAMVSDVVGRIIIKLQLTGVTVKRDESGFILGPITEKFSPGITAIIGVNGAGKSTLFSAINGTLSLTQGSIKGPSADSKVGFLPQDPHFPPHATVEDVLFFFGWTKKIESPPSEVDRLIQNLGLESKRYQRVSSLSGGMKRRLGIAQAALGRPDMLLLDEPTAGLDPVQRLNVRKIITQNLSSSVTLVSTHLGEDVRAFADNILALRDGKVIFSGTPEQLEAEAGGLQSRHGESLFEVALHQIFLEGSVDD